MNLSLNKKFEFIFTKDFIVTAALSFFAASLYFSYKLGIIATGILIIVAVGVTLHRLIVEKQKIPKPLPVIYCWIAVYLVRLIWLFGVSDDPENGMSWLDAGIPYLIVPVLIQYMFVNEKILKNVLIFFVYFSLLFCLITIGSVVYHLLSSSMMMADWLADPKGLYPRAYSWSNYNHPSFLCVIYLLAIPAAVYLKKIYQTKAVSFVLISLLFVSETMVLLFTGARIGMLILPILLWLSVLFMTSGKWRMRANIFSIAGIVIIVLLATHTGFSERFKDPVREQLIKTALFSIKEKPLLGVGTGCMEETMVSARIADELGYSSPNKIDNPHNQYVSELMQFGILGSIPLFATLLYLSVVAIRRKDFLLQSLLLILFAFMLTETPFDAQKGINYAMFFSSLFFMVNCSVGINKEIS